VRGTGLSAAMALGLAVSGFAWSQSEDALTACTELNDTTARLACYDRVLRAADDEAPAPSPAEASVSTPSSASRSAVSPAPAVETETTTIVVPPNSPVPTGETRGSASSRVPERGGRSTVTIVAAVENLSGLVIFTTEDGDVFEQVSRRGARYDEPPFSAELESGAMGSYFLTPENYRNRIRVRLRD
jgi:hypothetical protein